MLSTSKMAASCVSAELLKQVHLSGEVSCSSFKPNQFRASFCTNCSNLFDKHSVQAIPDDETLRRVNNISPHTHAFHPIIILAHKAVDMFTDYGMCPFSHNRLSNILKKESSLPVALFRHLEKLVEST